MTCARCSQTSRGGPSEGPPRSPRARYRARRISRGRSEASPSGTLAEGPPLRRGRPPTHARPSLRRGAAADRNRTRAGRARRARRAHHCRRTGGRMTLIGNELAERVLERALAHGGDFGEVYAEDRYGFGLGIDDSKIERPQTGSERGACVRVVQGEATYFGHVDGLGEDDLLRVAESVSQAVRSGDPRQVAALSAAAGAEVHAIRERPETVDAARKAEILRECDERARAHDSCVAQVMASYAENRRIVEIFNSDGVAAADDRTRVRL